MNRHWAILEGVEAVPFHTVATFLEGRLEERGTIDWALRLTLSDKIQRVALLQVLDRTERQNIEARPPSFRRGQAGQGLLPAQGSWGFRSSSGHIFTLGADARVPGRARAQH